MELPRKSSRNEFQPSPDIRNVEDSAEKKPASDVGSEHRLNLEGLRFQDQTRRKLKVRAVFLDAFFQFTSQSGAESTYSTYWNWRSVVTLCLTREIPLVWP